MDIAGIAFLAGYLYLVVRWWIGILDTVCSFRHVDHGLGSKLQQ